MPTLKVKLYHSTIICEIHFFLLSKRTTFTFPFNDIFLWALPLWFALNISPKPVLDSGVTLPIARPSTGGHSPEHVQISCFYQT